MAVHIWCSHRWRMSASAPFYSATGSICGHGMTATPVSVEMLYHLSGDPHEQRMSRTAIRNDARKGAAAGKLAC
jgi:hypothetical protein